MLYITIIPVYLSKIRKRSIFILFTERVGIVLIKKSIKAEYMNIKKLSLLLSHEPLVIHLPTLRPYELHGCTKLLLVLIDLDQGFQSLVGR